MTLSAEAIARIHALRKKGESIKVIAKLVGCSVGSAHLHTRRIEVSSKRAAELKRRAYDAGIAAIPKKVMLSACRRGGKARAAQGDYTAWTTTGTKASGLAYRKDELPVKSALDNLYSSDFKKEQCDSFFLDFCDTRHVIEHTVDLTHGITDALVRFEALAASGDVRKRVLFTRRYGSGFGRRLRRLAELGVEVRDIELLF